MDFDDQDVRKLGPVNTFKNAVNSMGQKPLTGPKLLKCAISNSLSKISNNSDPTEALISQSQAVVPVNNPKPVIPKKPSLVNKTIICSENIARPQDRTCDESECNVRPLISFRQQEASSMVETSKSPGQDQNPARPWAILRKHVSNPRPLVPKKPSLANKMIVCPENDAEQDQTVDESECTVRPLISFRQQEEDSMVETKTLNKSRFQNPGQDQNPARPWAILRKHVMSNDFSKTPPRPMHIKDVEKLLKEQSESLKVTEIIVAKQEKQIKKLKKCSLCLGFTVITILCVFTATILMVMLCLTK